MGFSYLYLKVLYNATKYRNLRKQKEQRKENQCHNERTYPRKKIKKPPENLRKNDQNREFESIT